MPPFIRRSRPTDLPFLIALERSLFEPARRESPRSLRRSLQSPNQEVWIACPGAGESACGAMILRRHPATLRIYSIGVHRDQQGQGVGAALIQHAEERAKQLGCQKLSLEADAANQRLVDGYQKRGYRPVSRLPGYYGPQKDGLRMVKIRNVDLSQPSKT